MNNFPQQLDWSLGKLPPQDIEFEQHVLGQLLVDPEAFSRVSQYLKAESFYKEAHSHIYKACQQLNSLNEPIDMLMVTKELRKMGLLEDSGGPLYVSQLTNLVYATDKLEFYAAVISEKHTKREIIRLAQELSRMGYDEESEATGVVNYALSALQGLFDNEVTADARHIKDILVDTTKSIESRLSTESGISGIPSGMKTLDFKLGGFQNTDLLYVAGRPGMGKSAFALSAALNIASGGIPVAFFSLEMGDGQLALRLCAQISGIDVGVLIKQRIDGDRLSAYYVAKEKLEKMPIYINDISGLSVNELRNKTSRLVKKRGVKILFVDYVQLLKGDVKDKSGNREQEISSISRTLKLIAKENNIPVVALAQLSRSVEQRGGAKKPILSDLRESGSLEQDADAVAFLYRPEYYGIKETEDGNSTQGLGEFIIAKHRNGSTCIVPLRFVDYLAKYEDFDNSFTPHPDSRITPNTNFLNDNDPF